MSVEIEDTDNALNIELRFSTEDLHSIVPDGDVGYLYVFECGHSGNFKAFSDQGFELKGGSLQIKYRIPQDDHFVSKLDAACGRFMTTGYSLRNSKSVVFAMSR